MTIEGMGDCPKEVLLGLTMGQWPVQCFTVDAHATHWLGEDPNNRKLYRVRVINPVELEYIPPGDARLVPKNRAESA